ncbi:MAG TPA: ABC transporter permease [Methylomirabilota bacterium]|nr:ABC transporter permease [Methylomirabilota bacterium]
MSRAAAVRGGRLLVLVLFLAAWEILPRVPVLRARTFLDPNFVSLPSLVVARLWETTFGAKAGYLWIHAGASLSAALAGFVAGAVLGFAMGLGLSQSDRARGLLKPFIDAFSAVPPVLLVPLITLVFGLGTGSKIATSAYIVFFVVFYNSYKGGSALPESLRASCRLLGGSRWSLLRTVVIPSALGWAFTAFPTAVGYALIGVVVAEFFGSPVGLGSIIVASMNSGSATDLMVSILVLAAMGAALVALMRLAERRVLHWRPEYRSA